MINVEGPSRISRVGQERTSNRDLFRIVVRQKSQNDIGIEPDHPLDRS